MARRFRPRSVLSAREQLARVRSLYPHFESRVTRGSVLVVEGDVRPTSRSAPYRVRIEYEAGGAPEVSILSPALKPVEEGGRLQHVYPGDRLCLYRPWTDEWTPDKSLAHTIVPWVAEWLFYYELWHATGAWLGGGSHPHPATTFRRDAPKERPYDPRPR
jgi:hypothetical protein